MFDWIKIEGAESKFKNASLLDVGCDTGNLLLWAQEQGAARTVGLDVSVRAFDAAKECGLEVYLSDVTSSPEELGNFDIVTAVDVVEHVSDPVTFLRGIRRHLVPGGFCYMETPNSNSVVYQLGRIISNLTNGRPAFAFYRLFPPQHAQYFSEQAIKQMAAEGGFSTCKIWKKPLHISHISLPWPIRLIMYCLQLLDKIRDQGLLYCIAIESAAE